MEKFVKGDIVVTPFPFSDLSSSIKRPALVVANLNGQDLIVAQITTKQRNDDYQVVLSQKDLTQGALKVNSFIRPNKILSIRSSIIIYKLGTLKNEKTNEVIDKIVGIFRK
jgi:mRNA interferase MazF